MAGIVGAIIRNPKIPGIVGAIMRNPKIPATLPPYNPHYCLHIPFKFHYLFAKIQIKTPQSLPFSSTMVQEINHQNHSPEVEDSPLKIPKLDHENGICQAPGSFFFGVKKLSGKAVLPSRGSPLSAGYDQNHSPEVEEPTPKIPKHDHENGICQEPGSFFFRVKKLSEKAVLPSRGSPLSAGYDLSSAAETKVPARGKALIPTDLSIAVPEGTYARIAPRSGLAWKHSIDVGAGVIDADYRGPVGVILFNHSDADFEVKVGDRIAQLIIEIIVTPEVEEVEDLDATLRGSGGFGSTGVRCSAN